MKFLLSRELDTKKISNLFDYHHISVRMKQFNKERLSYFDFFPKFEGYPYENEFFGKYFI